VELDPRLRKEIVAELRAIDAPETLVTLADSIAHYVSLVASWARRMNLTGLRDPAEIARRFVFPVFQWARLLPVQPQTIVDIGSGAGFPGIPLAMMFPEAEVLLVEARERRHHFERYVVRQLGLSNTSPLLGRAEELPSRESDLGVAQALAPLPQAVFHVKRWTRIGGIVAIPQNREQPAVLDSDLDWIGCPNYNASGGGRRSFLWMSRRRS
jgi:16S rRNA (guanine527-N7)-methyltransferase